MHKPKATQGLVNTALQEQPPIARASELTKTLRHKLTNAEKKAYLDAELCLMNTPAELDLRGARTVFDELQSIHVNIAQIAHFVGAFLPFHRYFMWAHEYKLETVCGYTGAQP
jgi:tyrosinase